MTSHGKDDLALEAARASTERYARGEERGLLDGVPFGVKDDLDVEGYVCHVGMRYDAGNPFFKESTRTVWAVRKMQEAGAVMVGKLAMHELGVGEYPSLIPSLIAWRRLANLEQTQADAT